MKKSILGVLLFLSGLLCAQNKVSNYETLWEEVSSQDLKLLPKSALQKVNTIYSKAVKEDNEEQKIKCLLYKSKFSLILDENANLKIIQNFKTQIEQTDDKVSKAILHSLLAHLYLDYFRLHRWKFYDRTQVSDVLSDDFRTWDLNTLYDEIHKHFKESLVNKDLLKEVDLTTYKTLVLENKRTKESTVYEFLAYNALSFYRNKESGITQPKSPFVLDKKEYLTEIESYDFKTKNKKSIRYLSLKIYQELIQFYKIRKNQEAYFRALLQAINYIGDNSGFKNFKQIKLEFLESFQKKHPFSKARAFVDFEIAKTYYEFAETYKAKTNTGHQFDFNKALAISEGLLQKYPECQLSGNLKELIRVIKAKELTCKVEAYAPIDQNLKALISYRNVTHFYGRIYKLNQREYLQLKREKVASKRMSLLQGTSVYKEWVTNLPDQKDCQKHSTEILLPKIPKGTYVITGGFNKENLSFNFQYLQVTNLTFLKTDNVTFQVLDRQDGKAYDRANVRLETKRRYKRDRRIIKSFATDKNGFFKTDNDKYYGNVRATVTTETDTAYFENIYLYKKHNYTGSTKIRYKSFVFTDRSIYRPGQQVFLKAIVLKKEEGVSEVLDDEVVEVVLYDVNNKEIKRTSLELNEFGTVATTFQLPIGGLNGEYSFRLYRKEKKIGWGSTSVWVEEYKRPTFKTTLEPTKGVFKINDSLIVSGNALALSGSKVANAKVSYRVVRKARFPRWCWWAIPSKDVEIAFGETKTDINGVYKIKFKALPDASLDKETYPVFNYTIFADVTDINGETRSTEAQVKVGYHALTINMTLNDKMDSRNKNELTVTGKNLNGQFVAVQGMLKIYKLIAPQTMYRNRPWSSPDVQTFSKEEYGKLFPFETYESADLNPKNWKKGKEVLSKKIDTEKKDKLSLGKTRKWELGKYIAVVTAKDQWGQLVRDEQIFTLVNPSAKTVSDGELFEISIDKKTYEPNDFVTLSVGSSINNMTVFVEVEKNHKIISIHQIHLDSQIKRIKIPVSEKDRGGFAIKWHRVNYNAMDSGIILVSVPYESKDLSIETLTFRDLLEPGATQKWSFKIKGVQKEKATAEVLASMYDVSLDQFKPHVWSFNPVELPVYRSSYQLSSYRNFRTIVFESSNNSYRDFYDSNRVVSDKFNWYGLSFRKHREGIFKSLKSKNVIIESIVPEEIGLFDSSSKEAGVQVDEDDLPSSDVFSEEKELLEQLETVKARTNFNETAFFFPQLKTDENGEVSFEFTMPEDITQWKLQLLAHDKTLNAAVKTLTTITQKELMVQPNVPRFLREGDKITLSAKISNLSSDVENGKAKLELTDPITGNNIDALLQNHQVVKEFSVLAKENNVVSWELQIPENISAIQYKIVAASKNYSDGEQSVIPVLSNRTLVTETLPLWVNGEENKMFTLQGLKNNKSKSLKNHQLTLEITSNPAWYAVQALPYLMEYPHECAEQTFSRYYANKLASHIVSSSPKIKEVFKQWANSNALMSNLEKNQELKSIIIEETPWLRDAVSETEQKKRIALLFDLSKMQNNLHQSIEKLAAMQFSNGAFPWFAGSDYANKYITQHIVQGYSHLEHLGVVVDNDTVKNIVKKAQLYLDTELVKGYEQLLLKADKLKATAKTEKEGAFLAEKYMKAKHLHSFQLQYLYVRSFKNQQSKDKKLAKVVDYYLAQSVKYWKEQSLYNKGLIALVQHRDKNLVLANNIVASLEENSITNDEMGMYWKENTSSWHWYQSPIETQSLLIEVFHEIKNNRKTVDHLKRWLLKNKQTQQWKTTKATSEAVYALLLQGMDWLAIDDSVEIYMGGEELKVTDLKVEAGTGYFKTKWKAEEITTDKATVSLKKKTKGIAWGGLYWQYFEELDKIKFAKTPLKLDKKIFKKTNTMQGPLLTKVNENTILEVGDLLTVRVELSTDRNLEFIHMKDMRASGLEPVEVLSGYKRQDGLGYYQSTKDTSTHFFFDKIKKGTYVFEYDVRVSHKGVFSNGITTIQSMYAPEFSSHSEGIRIEVK